jgi:hypothetical protein
MLHEYQQCLQRLNMYELLDKKKCCTMQFVADVDNSVKYVQLLILA